MLYVLIISQHCTDIHNITVGNLQHLERENCWSFQKSRVERDVAWVCVYLCVYVCQDRRNTNRILMLTVF